MIVLASQFLFLISLLESAEAMLDANTSHKSIASGSQYFNS
jgi:hypothetical protein